MDKFIKGMSMPSEIDAITLAAQIANLSEELSATTKKLENTVTYLKGDFQKEMSTEVTKLSKNQISKAIYSKRQFLNMAICSVATFVCTLLFVYYGNVFMTKSTTLKYKEAIVAQQTSAERLKKYGEIDDFTYRCITQMGDNFEIFTQKKGPSYLLLRKKILNGQDIGLNASGNAFVVLDEDLCRN